MQTAYAHWILANPELSGGPRITLTMEPNDDNAWRVTWTRDGAEAHALNFVTAADAKLGVQMAFALLRGDGWHQLSFGGPGSFDLDAADSPTAAGAAARQPHGMAMDCKPGKQTTVKFGDFSSAVLATVLKDGVRQLSWFCVKLDDGTFAEFDIRMTPGLQGVFDGVSRADGPTLDALAARIEQVYPSRTEFLANARGH